MELGRKGRAAASRLGACMWMEATAHSAHTATPTATPATFTAKVLCGAAVPKQTAAGGKWTRGQATSERYDIVRKPHVAFCAQHPAQVQPVIVHHDTEERWGGFCTTACTSQ